MIKSDSVVVMIGKRNTGKSFLTKDLLFHHQDLPAGTVICPTENANKFYSNIVPPIFIHDEYEPKITNEFIKRQKDLKKRIVDGDDDFDHGTFEDDETEMLVGPEGEFDLFVDDDKDDIDDVDLTSMFEEIDEEIVEPLQEQINKTLDMFKRFKKY